MSKISKETFCNALTLIKEQEEIDKQFGEALSNICDGHIVYGTKNKYLEALLAVLKEAADDKYDYIEWWLYEATDEYTVGLQDGTKEWHLKTPEALYDYIINECN